MAANLLSVTATSIDGIPTGTTIALNKGKIMGLVSLNSGADTSIQYRRVMNNISSPSKYIVSDNFSTIQTAIQTTNAYTFGKKFPATITEKGGVTYDTPQSQEFSVDSIIWAKSDPSDANKTIWLYQDELQGEIIVKANVSLAGLITATTT